MTRSLELTSRHALGRRARRDQPAARGLGLALVAETDAPRGASRMLSHGPPGGSKTWRGAFPAHTASSATSRGRKTPIRNRAADSRANLGGLDGLVNSASSLDGAARVAGEHGMRGAFEWRWPRTSLRPQFRLTRALLGALARPRAKAAAAWSSTCRATPRSMRNALWAVSGAEQAPASHELQSGRRNLRRRAFAFCRSIRATWTRRCTRWPCRNADPASAQAARDRRAELADAIAAARAHPASQQRSN